MILPGIIGGFLLKAMGMYEVSLDAIRSADVIYIAVFVLGAATGLGLFSKLLKYLLDHFNDITMAVLVGLMAGALRALWPYLGESGELLGPSSGDPIRSGIGCGVIGLADVIYIAVFVLGAATGLGLFSKLLKYLLDHFNDITMAVLVGLMAGALRALWPYLGESGELLGPSSGDPIWSVIVCGVIGFGFVLMLIFAGRRLEKTTPHSA